jgi:hypothetical protein
MSSIYTLPLLRRPIPIITIVATVLAHLTRLSDESEHITVSQAMRLRTSRSSVK